MLYSKIPSTEASLKIEPICSGRPTARGSQERRSSSQRTSSRWSNPCLSLNRLKDHHWQMWWTTLGCRERFQIKSKLLSSSSRDKRLSMTALKLSKRGKQLKSEKRCKIEDWMKFVVVQMRWWMIFKIWCLLKRPWSSTLRPSKWRLSSSLHTTQIKSSMLFVNIYGINRK